MRFGFRSRPEVIREGLRLLRKWEKVDQIKLEKLRRAIQLGIDQADRGEVQPITDELVEEIKAEEPETSRGASGNELGMSEPIIEGQKKNAPQLRGWGSAPSSALRAPSPRRGEGDGGAGGERDRRGGIKRSPSPRRGEGWGEGPRRRFRRGDSTFHASTPPVPPMINNYYIITLVYDHLHRRSTWCWSARGGRRGRGRGTCRC